MNIHDTKVCGFAFWDVTLTAISAAGLTYYVGGGIGYWFLFLVLFIILSLGVHKMFGVTTKLTSIIDLK